MATRESSSKPRKRPRAELHSDSATVRALLDHVAEELAKEYISLMKETASKLAEQED